MRRFIGFAVGLLAALAGTQPSTAAEGRELRVLYVGQDPAGQIDRPWYVDEGADDRWSEMIRERMPAFEKLLNEHFDEVTTTPVTEYTPAMSADYDVTILDALPKPLNGEPDSDRSAGPRLPKDFDRPTIMISDVGPFTLGSRGLGWKIDHLCQCLFDHAHGIDVQHPIFTTPHRVRPTLEERAVPSSFRWHAGAGRLGKTMPMWRVSTEEFGRTLIGCVSFAGLEDSPDGEVIAGGDCMKGIDAVAIGRQGNYLHWGFAASPNYMTDEAKLALVNAVHYISRFAGQRPFVARDTGVVTRADMDDTMYLLGEEGYAAINSAFAEAKEKMREKAAELREKQQRGEGLSEVEKQMLENAERPMEYTRQQIIEYGVPQAVRDRFGEDWEAYREYYASNRDYLAPQEGPYLKPLDVDEDVKSLGIANNDVRLLEKCVELLESEEQAELAQRVLERYTQERFASADEWRSWLKENRDALFFTEVGGFKFMVAPAGLSARPPRATAESGDVSKASPAAGEAEVGGAPVRWSIEVAPASLAGGESATIVVSAKVARGWHIYDTNDAGSPFTPTTLAVVGPAGEPLDVQWQRPAASIDARTQSRIFEGDVSFTGRFSTSNEAKGKQTLKLIARYQACNARECLLPKEKELAVSFDVR